MKPDRSARAAAGVGGPSSVLGFKSSSVREKTGQLQFRFQWRGMGSWQQEGGQTDKEKGGGGGGQTVAGMGARVEGPDREKGEGGGGERQ
ncbi:hypothetical protein TIFTF001_054721 [Ficus carica]|uniref:Uncharacterized protein n=1 Tax=Ficus carica TaxID=3494 RepID=A0AA88EDC6_FICCA|nr:hypothetical protein TIFTF001_054721 [Ficus carica]